MILTTEAAEVLEDALDRYVYEEDAKGLLPIEVLDLCIALGRILKEGAEIIDARTTRERYEEYSQHI